MLVSRNALRQSKQAYCSVMTTTISGKVDTINEHIDQIMEDAPKKLQLKVSVKLNDDDWQKIQELFDQERKWIIGKMQEQSLVLAFVELRYHQQPKWCLSVSPNPPLSLEYDVLPFFLPIQAHHSPTVPCLPVPPL